MMRREDNEERARRDEALVDAYLKSLAEPEGQEHALPGAGQIWWKAQLQRRQALTERAMRPLSIAEGIGPALVGILAAGGLVWAGLSFASAPLLQGVVFAAAGLSALAAGLTLRWHFAR